MNPQPVLFDETPTRDGGRIGIATLNAPRSLNALSLEMAQLLMDRLEAWASDASIVAVWLEGSGDKGFCSGGDVVAMYRAIIEGDADDFATTYFAAEYRLDYRIHTYAKPLIVWGNGIVMGGGLGLMAGAGQRVATESTRIAMPEITIGLYPDVGASWFLARMPPGVGVYLGLTGAQLNARDALELGLADRVIPHARRAEVLAALSEADFSAPHATVRRVLGDFEAREQAPPGQVMARLDVIQSLVDTADPVAAVRRILADDRDDAWLAANRARLAAGCPMTAQLGWHMQARHRHSSLAETLRDELNLSVQCCRHRELAEGVRALLVDKDKAPRWSHADVASVPASDIEGFLAPLWSPQDHPLRDL